MPDTTHAFELVGGPFDGATVPCARNQYLSTVLILISPGEGSELLPLGEAGLPLTAANRTSLLYSLAELEEDPSAYDGEDVYHRCTDDLFRPAILKAALGL